MNRVGRSCTILQNVVDVLSFVSWLAWRVEQGEDYEALAVNLVSFLAILLEGSGEQELRESAILISKVSPRRCRQFTAQSLEGHVSFGTCLLLSNLGFHDEVVDLNSSEWE